MADLRLRICIIEKNERGQEVELVRKTIQFKPQVNNIMMKPILKTKPNISYLVSFEIANYQGYTFLCPLR